MSATLVWKAIPAYIVGIVRGLSAIIGIAATLLYPLLHSRISTVRTGLWSIWMQVIDMLLFKGMEELNNIVEHAKQRHHIIGQYVMGNKGLVQDVGTKDQKVSNFLKKFYTTNYF